MSPRLPTFAKNKGAKVSHHAWTAASGIRKSSCSIVFQLWYCFGSREWDDSNVKTLP